MNELREQIRNCKRCPLYKTLDEGCLPVPGIGPKNAKLMFVAEAPGQDEEIIGEPLVGLCGQLFTKVLNEVGINRKECYVCNVLNCNPRSLDGTKNRPPTEEEISSCKIHLWNQIKMVNPGIIVTLGKVSTKLLLSTIRSPVLPKNFKMNNVVGQEYKVNYMDATIIPNFHPSFVLVYGRSYLNLFTDVFRKVKEKLDE